MKAKQHDEESSLSESSNHSRIRGSRRQAKKAPRHSPTVVVLGVGLLFCCIDIVYFVYHIDVLVPHHPSRASIDNSQQVPRRVVTSIAADTSRNVADYIEKGPIIQLLREAGFTDSDLTPELVGELPTWKQVTDLYGNEPVIVGINDKEYDNDSNPDVCKRFQESPDPAEHFIGTAGTFNTGTNLLAELLIHNCEMPARMAKYGKVNKGIRWQVPWGKHTPIQYRLTNKADEHVPANSTLPIVTVRDPGQWMHSMCRHSYAMDWVRERSNNKHCPNLVANAEVAALDETLSIGEPVSVSIDYAIGTKYYPSMVHHWNTWYTDYYLAFDTDYKELPRLIVRFEDLIFYPRNVTERVCKCGGGVLKNNGTNFEYIVESAKVGSVHGKEKTGYVDAMIKYGHAGKRWQGMERADLEFARDMLDPTLMRVFKYKNIDNVDEYIQQEAR